MPSFNLGTVFSRFFNLLGQNFALFALLGLIGIVVPTVAITYGMVALIGMPFGQPITDFSIFTPDNIGIFIGAVVVLVALNLAVLSMITEVAIVRSVGKTVDFGAVVSHAIRNILPLLVISILVTLMLVFGFMLLIIPGIFLALCTCIAIPSYVGEPKRGIFGSISRSFELTKGRRWWILLIFIVIFILALVVGGLMGMVMVGSALATGSLTQDGANFATSLSWQLVNSAFDAVMNLLGTIFVAAMYVCLRESRESLTPENTADVFK